MGSLCPGVVLTARDVQDAHGSALLCGVLQQPPRREHFVIRVRRNDKDPIGGSEVDFRGMDPMNIH